nr:protein CTR9 homolog [Tanacetum cinerariifolium]
ICDDLEVNDKNPDALCMLGHLELKNDDWVKAKDTFRAAKDASNEIDSYVTHCQVLVEHPTNMYVANGADVVKDNKEKDKIRAKSDKIKSKREA